MAKIIVVSAFCEGAEYVLGCRTGSKIRIFNDRWVHDDMLRNIGMSLKRERLTKNKFRRVKNAAKQNMANAALKSQF